MLNFYWSDLVLIIITISPALDITLPTSGQLASAGRRKVTIIAPSFITLQRVNRSPFPSQLLQQMDTPRLVFGEVTVVALENSKQTPAQTLLLSLPHIKALSSIKQLAVAVSVFSIHVTAALLLLSHPGHC